MRTIKYMYIVLVKVLHLVLVMSSILESSSDNPYFGSAGTELQKNQLMIQLLPINQGSQKVDSLNPLYVHVWC